MFEDKDIKDYVSLPQKIFGEDCFIMDADGDGFHRIGIRTGDKIVFHKQSTAEPGQLVAVKYNGKLGMRRYFPEKDNICLTLDDYANDEIVESCEIIGVATHCICNLANRFPPDDTVRVEFRGTIS